MGLFYITTQPAQDKTNQVEKIIIDAENRVILVYVIKDSGPETRQVKISKLMEGEPTQVKTEFLRLMKKAIALSHVVNINDIQGDLNNG